MTNNQRETLEFIERYKQDHGLTPTLAEISAHFGLKYIESSFSRVQALIKHGYLRRVPGQHRGLEIVNNIAPAAISSGHVCPNCGTGLSVEVVRRAA